MHDLLVIPSNKKLYRFRANTDGFSGPEKVDYYDDDHRNVMNIAQADEEVFDPPRGPAFSVLPNKPDPATSQISCYLVNSAHLRAANPWTTAAWNSEPSPKTTGLTPDPRPRDEAPLDFLAAGPNGAVYRVQEGKPPQALQNLSLEGEIYTQLRNGLVAGSVWCREAEAVLPLVNITAVFPKEPAVPESLKATPPGPAVNVHGTWDFKWPQGAVIRVAFQELTKEDASVMRPLAQLINKYQTIARRWLNGTPNISFEFVDEVLPAPDQQRNGMYSLRSPAGWLPVAYDVLVSFASMPAVIAGGDPVTLLTGQASVLGSYAKRINYGTPTTLVGPNREFTSGRKLDAYFDDPMFEEIVLHELGHVLGIAHVHQSPLYESRPKLGNDRAINEVLLGIRDLYWTKFSPEIPEEIRNLWPSLPVKGGAVPFSDWLPYRQHPGKRLETESVLAHPIWSELTELDRALLDPRGKPHQSPTAFDETFLALLYPPTRP